MWELCFPNRLRLIFRSERTNNPLITSIAQSIVLASIIRSRYGRTLIRQG